MPFSSTFPDLRCSTTAKHWCHVHVAIISPGIRSFHVSKHLSEQKKLKSLCLLHLFLLTQHPILYLKKELKHLQKNFCTLLNCTYPNDTNMKPLTATAPMVCHY